MSDKRAASRPDLDTPGPLDGARIAAPRPSRFRDGDWRRPS